MSTLRPDANNCAIKSKPTATVVANKSFKHLLPCIALNDITPAVTKTTVEINLSSGVLSHPEKSLFCLLNISFKSLTKSGKLNPPKNAKSAAQPVEDLPKDGFIFIAVPNAAKAPPASPIPSLLALYEALKEILSLLQFEHEESFSTFNLDTLYYKLLDKLALRKPS